MYARFIRWAFARFYREFAWTYDWVATAVSAGAWYMWASAALPYLRGQTLELGCGTGHLQRALAVRFGATRAVGLDASPQMLALTRRNLAHIDVSGCLTRAVAQALPFASASFDSIVATFPTEYIIHPATIGEVARVLRPGGRLVVVLAATFHRDGLYQRIVDVLYRVTLQRSPRTAPEPVPQSLLGQRLAEHGFAVDERWDLIAHHQVQVVIGQRGTN